MNRLITLTIFALLAIFQSAIAQEIIVIKSKNLKCNDTIRVYNPEPISKNQTAPTLFLLHGWSGSYKDWGNKYDLQAISNKYGFRIITPDGFYNGWYLNNSDQSKMQWRKFFDQELFPQMKEKYKLEPYMTFITGLSMGGHGAINLFMDNPQNFRTAGSMSGVLDLQLTSLRDTELAKVIGNNKERIDNESAINRLDRIKDIKEPIIITCGYDDVYSICTEKFAEKCRENKIPHVMILSPGKHTWKYWGYALDEHLKFFTKILNEDNIGY